MRWSTTVGKCAAIIRSAIAMPTAVPRPCPKRPGRRLDADRMAIFGMARRLRADLAELLQVVDREPLVAACSGQIKHCVQQHRAMSGRQDEAVPVGPVGIGGVELQHVAEENGRDVGRPHRQAGMAAVGLFHRVDREESDRIGHFVLRRGRRHGGLLCSRFFKGPRPLGRLGRSNGRLRRPVNRSERVKGPR